MATQYFLKAMTAIMLLAGSALALEQVKEVPPPQSWDKFTILVAQFHTNVIKDKALYESVNFRGFHIDRSKPDLQAFARETQWPFYVDHAADKGYLHLKEKVRKEMTGKKPIQIRPNSLADPQTIDAMKQHLKINIGSAKGSSVFAYSFDDEISLASFTTPIEVDAHPLSIIGFQKVLKAEYMNIETLNAQYGGSFKDFADVKPKGYEEFRAQLKPKELGKLNLSLWCDWHSYMDTQFAECLADLTRYSNELDQNTPAGFLGGQGPNAFGGYDYRKLCKAVQWIEAYDIGANNEILRSFWSQKSPRVQSFFSSQNPKNDSWFLWYYLCHGNRGVLCWARVGKDPNHVNWFSEGKVADFIKANAKTFKELQGSISQKIIDGTFDHDPVAIYYSHPSIQVNWALDAAVHNAEWPNRKSSIDNNISTSYLARIGWLKTLEDLGIQAKFIHQDHLLEGMLQKGNFKVLLLNRALCLSDAEAAAIKAFSENGGTVIADHLCGVFDEHGKARAAGALDDFFGVKRDLEQGWLDGSALTEVNGELDYKSLSPANWAVKAPLYKEMAVFERGLAAVKNAKGEQAGKASVMVRNGKAVYMNLSPIGYLLKRGAESSKDWLALVSGLMKDAGVEVRVKLAIDGQPAQFTEPIFWRNGDRTTLCVVKNLDRRASIDAFGSIESKLGDTKVKLKLQFAKPVKDLKNERTGKDMGSGTDFEDDFNPWEANVYTYGN